MTDAVESAVEQARDAAGEKDVTINDVSLEISRAVEAPGVTHIKYRVGRQRSGWF